ncbi:MAG: hypothetical protein WC028_27855 [Candidatus Obscuribacterales bacterium]|jgi:hypothetical protein|nr:hypothetical protein [Cyanobacteriota bacterium erpe_2018_sw_21hr_WHONDRS-SW48-000092_B_bin.40]
MDTEQLDKILSKISKKKSALEEMQRFFDHLLSPDNAAGTVKIETWGVTKHQETHTSNERFFVKEATPEFRKKVCVLLESFKLEAETELQEAIAEMAAYSHSVATKKAE